MKQWMEKISRQMENWMRGRYGADELGQFLSVLSWILLILIFVFRNVITMLLFVAVMIYSSFRICSKNISKRQAENRRYLSLSAKPKSFLNLQKNRWTDRKTHKYFKCKQCGKILRVPKGKGKIKIHCRQCGTTFQKKT
jgi:ribosomal protein S27E